MSSLGLCAWLSSYIVSVSCMALKHVHRECLLPSHFTLGRRGPAINFLYIGFLLLSFIMIFFPPAPNPPVDVMNWSVVIYCGVLLFSFVYFIFHGRHNYAGPVEYVCKSEYLLCRSS